MDQPTRELCQVNNKTLTKEPMLCKETPTSQKILPAENVITFRGCRITSTVTALYHLEQQ